MSIEYQIAFHGGDPVLVWDEQKEKLVPIEDLHMGDREMNLGWECPNCSQVNAPDVKQCPCSLALLPLKPFTPMPYCPPERPRPAPWEWRPELHHHWDSRLYTITC